MPSIHIDLFSDVVCPWCYIGTERLRQVIDAKGMRDDVTVRLHPFFLAPDTPDAGVNLAAHLKKKTGRDVGPMYEMVAAAGRDVGIGFKFRDDQMGYPSVRAHALIALAEETPGEEEQRDDGSLNRADAVSRALFAAYFIEHANISDVDVLVKLGARFDIEESRVREALASPAWIRDVTEHANEAHRLGIQGVPFFVLNGSAYISGAQPAHVFETALDKAREAARQKAANT